MSPMCEEKIYGNCYRNIDFIFANDISDKHAIFSPVLMGTYQILDAHIAPMCTAKMTVFHAKGKVNKNVNISSIFWQVWQVPPIVTAILALILPMKLVIRTSFSLLF